MPTPQYAAMTEAIASSTEKGQGGCRLKRNNGGLCTDKCAVPANLFGLLEFPVKVSCFGKACSESVSMRDKGHCKYLRDGPFCFLWGGFGREVDLHED